MRSKIKGKPFIAALITSIHLIAFPQQSKSLNDTMPFMKLWFYILAISFSLSNVLAQTAQGKPSGYELMTNKQYGNCIACHDMPGVQGMVSNFAPSLKGVGQKFSAPAFWLQKNDLTFIAVEFFFSGLTPIIQGIFNITP